MFTPQLLIAAVVAAAHVPSVLSFQPGSDYDIYKTTNLYNCTGNIPVSNLTVSNAVDTLPQIDPSAGHGWEQWSLFLHGTFPMVLRWNKGDPSSFVPSPAHFDLLIVDVNGTTVQGTVIGNLSYTNRRHVKQIAIGDNTLRWDSDELWFNVSVKMDGYRLKLDSFSSMCDAFYPSVAFYNGLLDQSGGWFGSAPLIRGHVVGSLYTPLKQKITLGGLTVMKHMFSENPLPFYIKKYTGGTFWGHSTLFYDSQVFYQTKTTNGTVHEAAFLGRAIPAPDGIEGDFASTWATYAVTDDTNLYNLSIDTVTNRINTSFPGCPNTNNIPYLFNINASTLVGEFTDLGGGTTSYYSIDGTTSAPFNGAVTYGALAGMFEEYETPSTDCGT